MVKERFDRLTELIGKNLSDLTDEELEILLDYYKNHEEKHKYEFKISQLKRAIKIRKQAKNREPEWVKLAKEDKLTKEKWLELGATFECEHSYTTWFFKGKPFYRWFSGVHINQEIHRLREADKRLMKMIECDITQI